MGDPYKAFALGGGGSEEESPPSSGRGEAIEHRAVYDRVFDTIKRGDREGFRDALKAAVVACMEETERSESDKDEMEGPGIGG